MQSSCSISCLGYHFDDVGDVLRSGLALRLATALIWPFGIWKLRLELMCRYCYLVVDPLLITIIIAGHPGQVSVYLTCEGVLSSSSSSSGSLSCWLVLPLHLAHALGRPCASLLCLEHRPPWFAHGSCRPNYLSCLHLHQLGPQALPADLCDRCKVLLSHGLCCPCAYLLGLGF